MSTLPPNFPTERLPEADAHKLLWFYRRFVEDFYWNYRYGHFLLAAYAAVPALLTPDLLYKIWQNFNTYKWDDEPLMIDRIAVSDVLLSPLCREVGFELYEMDHDIRLVFLAWLEQAAKQDIWKDRGLHTIEAIARFSAEYHQLPNAGSQRWGDVYNDTQRWEALSYSEPALAASLLFNKLYEAAGNGRETELLRTLDTIVKTGQRLHAVRGENDQALDVFNEQMAAMKVWKSLLQENRESFLELLDRHEGLKALLSESGGDTGIAVKLKDAVVEKLDVATERKLYALVAGWPWGENNRDSDAMAELLQEMVPAGQLEMRVFREDVSKEMLLGEWSRIIEMADEHDDVLLYISSQARREGLHCYIHHNSEIIADAEFGEIALRGRYASATAVLELEHAATEFWLDLKDERNVVWAASSLGQGTTLIPENRFTYSFIRVLRGSRMQITNRMLLGELMQLYKRTDVKTPELLCAKSAYDRFFIQGNNYLVRLQSLLRQRAYYDGQTSAIWNTELAASLSVFAHQAGLPVDATKQDYIEALDKMQYNSGPYQLFIYCDPHKVSKVLPREADYFSRSGDENRIVLFNPDYATVRNIFAGKQYREDIRLVYFAGVEYDSQIPLIDRNLTLQDFAALFEFQHNIRFAFFSNCGNSTFGKYLTQLGAEVVIGSEESSEPVDLNRSTIATRLMRTILEENDLANVLRARGRGRYYMYASVWRNKASMDFLLEDYRGSLSASEENAPISMVAEAEAVYGVNPLEPWESPLSSPISDENPLQAASQMQQEDDPVPPQATPQTQSEGSGDDPVPSQAAEINPFESRLSSGIRNDAYLLAFTRVTEGWDEDGLRHPGLREVIENNNLVILPYKPGHAEPGLALAGYLKTFGETLVVHPGEHPLRGYGELLRKAMEYGEGYYIIVSEYQQLVTMCKDKEERKAFEQLIMEMVLARMKVIITIREDFEQEHKWGYRKIRKRVHRFEIPLLLKDEVAALLTTELNTAKVSLVSTAEDAPFAARFVHDLYIDPEAMRYLPETLVRLYNMREGNHLTEAAYDLIGGVTGVMLEAEKRFRSKVEKIYNNRRILVKDDLQKRRWGSVASRNGKTLNASVTRSSVPRLYRVTINLEALGYTGDVAFFVHDTFSNEVMYKTVVRGKAQITLSRVYEAFTIGAVTEDLTILELDLNEAPGYPSGFYYKDVADSFRAATKSVYNATPVVVEDDTQKNRWGGQAVNGGRMLQATVKKAIIPGYFNVRIRLLSEHGGPSTGDVAFFLHDSFSEEIRYHKARDGEASISVTAYEAFTVGARTEDGTLLELDLNEVSGFPEDFYWEDENLLK